MPRDQIEETKKLMGALVRMKPKPHEEALHILGACRYLAA